MKEKIQKLAQDCFNEIIEIRRHIHQNPELSFHEFETSKFIKEKLTSWGIPFEEGFVKTGLVAKIANGSSEKVLALRADMDALPIKENTPLDFKSKNEGVMHACGHDVHTSCLLGAAKILNELKSEIDGTILFVFQPGEERLPGGAKLMLEEGALKDPTPNNMVGQHVFPDLPSGKVGFRSGMYMASCDELHITVKGKGGHAALPHKLVDPVLMSAELICALQKVVSRKIKADIPAVLSIGKIEGNGATNIIPDEVKLEGTFRCMNEEFRFKAHEEMQKIAKGVADSYGGEIDFDVRVGYPFLKNDPTITELWKNAATYYLGKENVVDLDLRMTAEDFAYFSQEFPSCFYRLGTNNKEMSLTGGLHNPKFQVDESAIEVGMGLMAFGAIKYFQ